MRSKYTNLVCICVCVSPYLIRAHYYSKTGLLQPLFRYFDLLSKRLQETFNATREVLFDPTDDLRVRHFVEVVAVEPFAITRPIAHGIDDFGCVCMHVCVPHSSP